MASLWHPTPGSPAPGLTGAIASPTAKKKEQRDKQATKSEGGSKGVTHRVIHKWLQHGRVEARVELAPEYPGGDVKAGADFSLSEAVYELRDVVCETPCGDARELVGCDQVGLDEQGGDQGGDERRGGAETRLGHVCERDARRVEVW